MSPLVFMLAARAERRAAADQRPTAFVRHRQSAGTACVRSQRTKLARILLGEKPGERPGDRPGDTPNCALDEGSA